MKKHLFGTVIFLFISINYTYSQGYLKENNNSFEDVEKYSKETFGFADDIPIRASLERYVPLIGDQRNTGSCTAWATTYYNLSIIYNRMFNITDKREKFAHAFDPYYMYSTVNKVANESRDCDNGTRISEAFLFLELIGGKKLLYPPYDITCSYETTNDNYKVIDRITTPYTLTGWEMESAVDFEPYKNPLSNEQVNMVKNEIGKYAFPVVVGFTDFGDTLDNVGSNGFWFPEYDPGYGHAMTIVGYDDTINGGSFRIVNSWGSDWGDNGYAWITYRDFKRFADVMAFSWIGDNIKTTSKYIDDLDNYVRMNAKNSSMPGRDIVYEGETSSDGKFNGYGIISYRDTDAHYAGWFTNGLYDGEFRVLNGDGFFQVTYRNGELIDAEQLGFAESDENLKKLELTNDYFSKMFPSLRFKNDTSDLNSVDLEMSPQ